MHLQGHQPPLMQSRHFKLQFSNFENVASWGHSYMYKSHLYNVKWPFSMPKIGISYIFSTKMVFLYWRESQTVKTECEELRYSWRATETMKKTRFYSWKTGKVDVMNRIPREIRRTTCWEDEGLDTEWLKIPNWVRYCNGKKFSCWRSWKKEGKKENDRWKWSK